ncbi:MAG: hypothetical protein RIB84_28000 [Sneathiellaceae bacterium]
MALQKRLAILAAVLLAGLFVAANVHFLTVAIESESGCVAPVAGKPPARRAC